ncbi:MAG: hypothetical protein GY733_22420 [bacterium]|nr:hypothetical protein [bacterium]
MSENVVAAANELARLGQRLRLHREEAMRRQQPQGPRGPIGEEQLEERQSGPTTILELNQLTDDDVRAAIAGERHVKALIWALRQTDDWLKAMDLIDAGWPKSTIQRWANKRNIERRVKPVQYGRARLCEFAWSRWRSE